MQHSLFPAPLLLAFALSVPVACSPPEDGGSSPDATTVQETEPNDTIDAAQAVGDLGRDTAFEVLGRVTADGSDRMDAYRLDVSADLRLEVRLEVETSAGDADFWIANPDGTVLRLLEESREPDEESGTYAATAGETVVVVVVGFDGDVDYVLTLAGT